MILKYRLEFLLKHIMNKIEKATADDFISIARLDELVWSKGEIDRSFMVDGEHAWRKWIDYALVFIAKDQQGKIVGAVVAFPTINDGWCIHKIFVIEAYRRDGIGRKLVSRILSEIDRKESRVFLSVDPKNCHAIKLYESLGFVKKELHKSYYRKHEHRYIMVRPVQWSDRKLFECNDKLEPVYV